MPPIDPAILKALSLDEKTTTLTSHGGSSFTGTFKLSTQDENGKEKNYFVKIGKGEDSAVMFAGEHLSLSLIHSTVPNLCPTSYFHGPLSSSTGHFLLTDFLTPSRSSSSLKPPHTLAQKLASLHSTPAPIPPGHSTPKFGFPLPTCCGSTIQKNPYRNSWAEFFAECRIAHLFQEVEKNHGPDPGMKALIQKIIETVTPRLLSDGHLTSPSGENIVPVLVHGDLWSGNHGTFVNEGGELEEMVFDPSSCYAHSEYEFGIMRMFGGFGEGFEREYWEVKGKDEPVAEWGDRVRLYELYHHLNHYSIFGGSYKGSAMRIMRSLIDKYGDGT